MEKAKERLGAAHQDQDAAIWGTERPQLTKEETYRWLLWNLLQGRVSFGVGRSQSEGPMFPGGWFSLMSPLLLMKERFRLFSYLIYILVFTSTKAGAQGSEKHSRQGSHLQPSLGDSS